MSFFVALAALKPTPPVIAGSVLNSTALQINLVTPSTEPQTGISKYYLWRRLADVGGPFSQVATLSPLAFPYTDINLTPNTSYDYELMGVDNGPQQDTSLPSPLITLTTQAAATGSFKFLDGLQQIGFTMDPNSSVVSWISRLSQLKAQVPNLRIVQFYINQAVLENPNFVGGDAQYDGSWDASGNSGGALITKLLNACAPLNLMAGFNVQSAAYNAKTTSFPSWLIAAYMSSSTYGPTSGSPSGASGARQGAAWFSSDTSNSGGYTDSWLWWNPPVQARVLSQSNWYAGRFNGNRNLYWWCNFGESAIPGVTGYTDTLAVPFYCNSLFPAMDATWTFTMRRVQLNYLNSDDAMAQVTAACNQYRIISWGPDCGLETGPHARVFQANYVFRGLKGGINGTSSYPNFVGVAGFGLEAQYASLSDTVGGYGPTKFADGSIPHMLTTMCGLQGAFIFCMYDQANSGWNSVRTTSNAPTANPPSGGGPQHPNAIDQFNAVLNQVPVGGAPVVQIANTSRPARY